MQKLSLPRAIIKEEPRENFKGLNKITLNSKIMLNSEVRIKLVIYLLKTVILLTIKECPKNV